MRAKYKSDEFLDKQIIQIYQNYGRDRDALMRFCENVNIPRWWVGQRAAVLGVRASTRREPPWSEPEVLLLEQNAHRTLKSLAKIFRRAGYSRTETAIGVKRKREKLGFTDARIGEGIYTANQLADVMGVDHKTVRRWIERDILKAKKAGIAAGEYEKWEIHARDVRRMLMDFTAEVEIRKADKFFLVDVLSGRFGG